MTTSVVAHRAALTDTFVELLRDLRRAATASMPVETAEARATPHQIEVLGLLLGSPEGMTMNELARHQGCAMSSATALIERLCRQGLVARSNDPEDRRVVRIQATGDAAAMVGCLHAGKRELAERALAPLSDVELENLIQLLTKIVGAIDTPETACG